MIDPGHAATRAPIGRWNVARAVSVAVLACTLFVVGTRPVSAQNGPSARDQREELRARRAQAASQIDVMSAEDTELRGALVRIDDDVRGQQALVDDARRAAETASRQADEAAAAAAAKQREVDQTRARLALMAVDSYMNPPVEGGMSQFQAADAQIAAEKKALIEIRVGHVNEVVEQLRAARHQLDSASERARDMREQAEAHRGEVEIQLARLVEAQTRQQGLVSQAEARLEAKLAEAAALESYDTELAAMVMAEQEALSATLRRTAMSTPAAMTPPGGSSAPTTTSDSSDPSRPAVTSPGDPTTPPVSTTLPTTTSPPTTSPTTPPPPTTPVPASVPLTTVGGITVNSSIAAQLGAMLDAARADGVILGGGGYRDSSLQIQLRRQNCGTSNYAIYEMPPSLCSPPTARPGTSNHERGLAIDFTYNGGSMGTRNNPGYIWLAANAARFGFYNLPSEPWHWSIDGH